jgi:hypothetical protein
MPLCMCKAAGDEATHIVSLLHALNLLCEIECSTLWSIHSSYTVSLHCKDVISCSSRISSSCALTNCERKLPIWQALRRWWHNIWAVFLTFSVRIPYIVGQRLHTGSQVELLKGSRMTKISGSLFVPAHCCPYQFFQKQVYWMFEPDCCGSFFLFQVWMWSASEFSDSIHGTRIALPSNKKFMR